MAQTCVRLGYTMSTCEYQRIGCATLQSSIQNVCDTLVAPASVYVQPDILYLISRAGSCVLKERNMVSLCEHIDDELVIECNANGILLLRLCVSCCNVYYITL